MLSKNIPGIKTALLFKATLLITLFATFPNFTFASPTTNLVNISFFQEYVTEIEYKLDKGDIDPVRGGYSIVLASALPLPGAEKLRNRFINLGIGSKIFRMKPYEKELYRICSGQFQDQESAKLYQKEMIELTGITEVWILPLIPEMITGTPDYATDYTEEKVYIPEIVINEDFQPVGNKPDKHAGPTNYTAFFNTYNSVIVLLQQKNMVELESYIHPRYGIFVTENLGAYVTIKNFRTFKDLFAYKFIDLTPLVYPITPEDFPKYICEKDAWTKTGSFSKELSGADRILTKWLDNLPSNSYTNVQVDLMRECENSITMGIIQVENPPFFHKLQIYFSYIDGRWYITAIDNIIPCSA